MKNSFVVQYGVHLWLASIGLTGPFGAFVAFFATRVLGDMLDRGIIKIDISIDKLKQALKEKDWKDAAEKAYGKAIAKVYTEKEKDEIRTEYLAALSKYVGFGSLPDNKNS